MLWRNHDVIKAWNLFSKHSVFGKFFRWNSGFELNINAILNKPFCESNLNQSVLRYTGLFGLLKHILNHQTAVFKSWKSRSTPRVEVQNHAARYFPVNLIQEPTIIVFWYFHRFFAVEQWTHNHKIWAFGSWNLTGPHFMCIPMVVMSLATM